MIILKMKMNTRIACTCYDFDLIPRHINLSHVGVNHEIKQTIALEDEKDFLVVIID